MHFNENIIALILNDGCIVANLSRFQGSSTFVVCFVAFCNLSYLLCADKWKSDGSIIVDELTAGIGKRIKGAGRETFPA